MKNAKPIKVAFQTLGCKLNFAETATIARKFTTGGYRRVEFEQWADIYVINTCSVTDNADKKFKSIVKSCLKINDKAFIIAIGCYAQLKPEEIADIQGVDLVLGAKEKFNVMNYIADLSKRIDKGEIHSCEIEEANTYVGSYSLGDRTRAFLKVQDGCDYKCTYCTIPLARGISRSDKLINILKNAEEIAQKNIKEIVLTGVNIGDYGKGEMGNKKHENTFLELLQALDTIKGIHRIRISSVEPNLLKNEVLDFCAQSTTFVPHFHIPLQSGSNEILKAMKRRYLKELYYERVQYIHQKIPNACIGVDVIVGFPGETDALFLETYNFLNELNIAYLHVFTYSERPNTEAQEMPNAIPANIRHKRSKLLRGLSAKKKRQFYESQLGTIQTVLWEEEQKEDFMYGFTANYIRVKYPYKATLVNTFMQVKLQNIDAEGIVEVTALN